MEHISIEQGGFVAIPQTDYL